MPVKEASSEETPYGRYITSEGWFVHNLEEALAVRFDQSGALYPLEPREAPFRDVGVNVRVLWPGDANAIYHHEDAQEGFLVLAGECLLVVEEQERPLRRCWGSSPCSRRSVPRRPSRAATAGGPPVRTAASNSTDTRGRHRSLAARRSPGPGGPTARHLGWAARSAPARPETSTPIRTSGFWALVR